MPPRLSRLRIAILVVVAILLTPLLLLVGALLVSESEWGESWVENRLASALGREVDIEGVDIELGLPLTVKLKKLRIGNPDWAETPSLVDATDVHALVEIPPLFDKQLVMPYLGAKSATVGLERQGDRASWRFHDGQQGRSPMHLSRIFLEDGKIAYRRKELGTSLDFQVNGSLGQNERAEWTATGTYRGERSKGAGHVPSLAPQAGVAIPIVGKATIGKTDLTVDGHWKPNLRDLEFKFTLAGNSLSDLRKIFGTNLPESPPFKLSGTLVREGQVFQYEPFQGKVGSTDIGGKVTVDRRGKQPKFRATLHSKHLAVVDLGSLIGVPPKPGTAEAVKATAGAKAPPAPPGDRVIPQAKFNVDRWDEMDADVRVKADRVIRPQALPLDSFEMHVLVKDSVMRLKPVRFGVAGGRITANVTLDATKKPVRGHIDVEAQGLQIGRLFPTVKSMDGSLGTLYGRGKLSGTGESLGTLLATSHGEIGMAVDGGQVSLLLVELLGLDFGEALGMLGTRNKQVALRCAAGGFKVEKGIALAENFVVDTTDTVVKIEGTVSLADEKLKLVAYPEPKDKSFFALRSPMEVEGSFRDPSVKPRAGPIAARVLGAAALAAIAPPLALLAFVETGPGKDTDCGKLLRQAQAKGAVKKPT